MVSPLWNACAENDVENLSKLLAEASLADREVADQVGTTPLIAAIKAGHVDVVRVLLEHGVDPNHASSEGRPEQHTTDPAILQLLHASQSKAAGVSPMVPPHGYDPNMQFWPPPPPGMFGGYYAGPPPMGPGPDGAPISFYAPPMSPPGAGGVPEHTSHAPYGPGNLPPPEIARMIPCRFFPACRYGASCLFAHPQGPPGAYFTPPPPMHGGYGGYEQAPHHPGAYAPYYAPPPPNFHHANMPMPIPGAPPMAGHGPQDPTSPVVQGGLTPPPFSPSVVPPGAAFAPPPPPMSPPFNQPMSPTYAVSAPPPAHVITSTPPVAMPAQSPAQAVYASQPMVSPASAFPSAGPVPPPQALPPMQTGQGNHPVPMSQQPILAHSRRANARRPSLAGGRRPPCIFFPSGRCKNGDDCRFPHVLPDGSNAPPGFTGRSGPRQRYPNGHALGGLDEKMAGMSLGDGMRGVRGPPRGGPRGPTSTAVQQRVPRADEFPTLAGANGPSPRPSPPTPTLANGMTAAQVLQAPAPPRKDSAKSASGSASAGSASESVGSGSVNGDSSSDDAPSIAALPSKDTAALAIVNGFSGLKAPVKIPLSFASAANSVVATTPELSVSA